MSVIYILGFVLAIIGLVAVATAVVDQVGQIVLPLVPEQISATYILIGGIVLVIAGAFIVIKTNKPKQKTREVPIYEGKHVIGYRRT